MTPAHHYTLHRARVLSLSTWALEQAAACDATDPEAAARWRKVAAQGKRTIESADRLQAAIRALEALHG